MHRFVLWLSALALIGGAACSSRRIDVDSLPDSGAAQDGGESAGPCGADGGACSASALCLVQQGVAVCECPAGIIGNGQFGAALFCASPCTVRNGGCDPNAACGFVDSAVTCACNPGFEGNGESGVALACTPEDDGGADAGPDAGTPDAGNVACGEAGQPCCAGGGCVVNGQLVCNLGECMVDANWTHWAGNSGDDSTAQYVTSADGSTVQDSVTGLVWQAQSGEVQCAFLSLGGYPSGWRTPTLIEAISLLDFAPLPATPPFPTFAPGGGGGSIDSATIQVDSPGEHWAATPLSNVWGSSPSGNTLCVHDTQGPTFIGRGPGAPPGRFVVTDDGPSGTVYDTVAQLTWQQEPPAGGYTWSSSGAAGSAQAYCAGLNLGGHASGWRVPSVKELASLVDFETSNPALDPAFVRAESTGLGIYWTTASIVDSGNVGTSTAVAIDFFEGTEGWLDPSTQLNVRCVR